MHFQTSHILLLRSSMRVPKVSAVPVQRCVFFSVSIAPFTRYSPRFFSCIYTNLSRFSSSCTKSVASSLKLKLALHRSTSENLSSSHNIKTWEYQILRLCTKTFQQICLLLFLELAAYKLLHALISNKRSLFLLHTHSSEWNQRNRNSAFVLTKTVTHWSSRSSSSTLILILPSISVVQMPSIIKSW